MERTARVRIGRVRMKGGADLRILPDRRREIAAGRMRDFERGAHHVRSSFEGSLTGYVLVAWDVEGYTFRALCTDNSPGYNTLPEWLAEAARRWTAERDMRRTLGLPMEEA